MTMDNHAARKAAVYEAALQLIARGVSPAAMTIQQLADTAGIGKGTVYGYFSSKEEILQGLAEYCFARENERIRVLFADCCTLAGLEERAVAYLQDIAANRMGDYKMIAQALGTRVRLLHGGVDRIQGHAQGQLLVALEGAAARADWTPFTQGREAIAHEIKVLGYVAESVHPH